MPLPQPPVPVRPPSPKHTIWAPRDFRPGDDQLVGLVQFLAFFGRVSRTMTNRDFDAMIGEMSA